MRPVLKVKVKEFRDLAGPVGKKQRNEPVITANETDLELPWTPSYKLLGRCQLQVCGSCYSIQAAVESMNIALK